MHSPSCIVPSPSGVPLPALAGSPEPWVSLLDVCFILLLCHMGLNSVVYYDTQLINQGLQRRSELKGAWQVLEKGKWLSPTLTGIIVLLPQLSHGHTVAAALVCGCFVGHGQCFSTTSVLLVFVVAHLLGEWQAERKLWKGRESTSPSENMRNGEIGPFFSFFPFSFFFQTLFDAFSFFTYINKMKVITGKMPTGLLKAVLVHWLEFSRNLGCPESTKSETLYIH